MVDRLNSNTWMAFAYVVVAVLAGITGLAEQSAQKAHRTTDRLPAFWFLNAMLFASIAVAHAGELGGAVADYARRGAHAEGWYDARRSIQVVVVAAVATLWALVTFLAIWRFPARRRRYLPMTVMITTLLCYSAVRLVSLHHVDALLYRLDFEGVYIGVFIEYLLVATGALIIEAGRRSTSQPLRAERELVNNRTA